MKVNKKTAEDHALSIAQWECILGASMYWES